jgi:hypothetical protein
MLQLTERLKNTTAHEKARLEEDSRVLNFARFLKLI